MSLCRKQQTIRQFKCLIRMAQGQRSGIDSGIMLLSIPDSDLAPYRRGIFLRYKDLSPVECLVCGPITSSKLEFDDLAKSQMTFGEHHQTPTDYGYYEILYTVRLTD